eukprot:TRINITY_DN3032_c0_g1_i1.p1 TRINITY_DN3032_c0_g1~~TRINITY_DN3032_c0_g1_i1.p1  ORF type:complete len:511 (+),score=53.02 TRINITY_DN3032_c0_g1_i1:219-1751(+)
MHDVEFSSDRQGTVEAVLVVGVATVFSSFAWCVVYFLGQHTESISGDDFSDSAGDSTYVDIVKPMGAVQILLIQSVIEGIFMSSVVGVPTLLAYLARKAENKRAAEAELHSLNSSISSRESVDTFTSNELRGIIVEDAWCDVDDDRGTSADPENDANLSRLMGISTRNVSFNPVIDFDPQPPRVVSNLTSCLKRSTRPDIYHGTRAEITAAIVVAMLSIRQIEQERERTPMPIPLPPKRAAFWCLIYGVCRAVSTLTFYMGLTGSLGICNVAVLCSVYPLFSTLMRTLFRGENLTLKHLPGSVLCVIGSVTVLFFTPNFMVSIFTLIVGGGTLAASLEIHHVIRTQVHPYFIAVSFTVAGSIICGGISIFTGVDSPSTSQWGYVMLLCVFSLVADTAAATSAPSEHHIPVGFARAISIALALGLQTVLFDMPPGVGTSMAAIAQFTAGILLEISRMNARYLPYHQLSSAPPIDDLWDPPETVEAAPPTPPILPVRSPRQKRSRPQQAMEV